MVRKIPPQPASSTLGDSATDRHPEPTGHDIITIDAGGTILKTVRDTAEQSVALRDMMEINPEKRDFFVDVDGAAAKILIDRLRPGKNSLPPGLGSSELSDVKHAAKFLGIPSVPVEIKHLYPIREKIRWLKEEGGSSKQLAAAYRQEGEALLVHGTEQYALSRLSKASSLAPDVSQDISFHRLRAQRFPKSAAPWLDIGKIHDEAENWVEAEKAYCKSLEKKLTNEGYYGLGIAQGAQEKYALSLKSIEEALKLGHSKVKCLFAIAICQFKMERYEDALRAIDLLAVHDPQDALVYEFKGDVHVIMENNAAAVEAFQMAVEKDPQNAGYFVALGSAQWDLGELAQGRASLRQAVQLEPSEKNMMQLGRMMYTMEEHSEAEDLLTKAYEKYPDSMPMKILLIDSCEKQRTAEKDFKAMTLCREILKEDASHVVALTHLTGILSRDIITKPAAIKEEAEKLLIRLISLTPNRSENYHRLGLVQWFLKKSKMAEKHFKKSMEMQPYNASYHYNFSMFCFTNRNQHSKSACVKLFHKHAHIAAELEPENQTYTINLAVANAELEKRSRIRFF